jgi:predicted nucleic acid-binding protein
MAILIDSGVLIALERGGQSLDTIRQNIPAEPFAISSVTASEMLVGVHRAASPQQQFRRQRFVENVLDTIPIIAFDLQVARVHASLWAEMQNRGRLIGDRDLLIAATAIAHGYDVLTANVRDFGSVPGLTVRQPAW